MTQARTPVMLQLIERIERLERQMAALDADIQELYSEANAQGYDGRILRRMIKLWRTGSVTRRDDDSLKTLYLEAVDIGVLESWF